MQKSGYYSQSGFVEVGTDPVLEKVVLYAISTPTLTPTPTSGTSEGTGGTGYTPDEGAREAARNTLTEYYRIVPSFFGLIFFLFFLKIVRGAMR
ncbi:hypothetical protein DRP05_11720 [Archaeoglobales archaeon]|nr:MAG: hypothetical protein DRP05_11720 [Archaeoglobales archaeon]